MQQSINERIIGIGDTSKYLLEELKDMVGFVGSLPCFRVYCWRNNIEFAKGYRGDSKKLAKIKLEGKNFANKTLLEIKADLNYKGGLDALMGLLKRHDITYKPSPIFDKLNKSDILEKIKELGDTSQLTPKEILDRVGVEIINPAQYLRRLGVNYKPKTAK